MGFSKTRLDILGVVRQDQTPSEATGPRFEPRYGVHQNRYCKQREDGLGERIKGRMSLI